MSRTTVNNSERGFSRANVVRTRAGLGARRPLLEHASTSRISICGESRARLPHCVTFNSAIATSQVPAAHAAWDARLQRTASAAKRQVVIAVAASAPLEARTDPATSPGGGLGRCDQVGTLHVALRQRREQPSKRCIWAGASLPATFSAHLTPSRRGCPCRSCGRRRRGSRRSRPTAQSARATMLGNVLPPPRRTRKPAARVL